MAGIIVHDCRFPDKILRAAKGGPRFKTSLGTGDSGIQTANQDWPSSIREWVVGRKMTTKDGLDELLAFFECRGGQAYGFLFRDPSDFFVGLKYTQGVGFEHDAASNFATGDASTTVFQLQKKMVSGPTTKYRKITRPLDKDRSDAPTGALDPKVYLGGVEQVSGWTLNYSTGALTFTSPPGDGVAIGWSGMFDIPANFQTDEPEFEVDAYFVASCLGIPVREILE